MNTVQIKIVAQYKAKDKTMFYTDEKFIARRVGAHFMDYTTPFQIIDGNRSGHEIPYKNAIVLKEEKSYTQEQYDEILSQRNEALEMKDEVIAVLAKHGQTITELQDDKIALLNTIERAVTHNEIQALPREVVQALESFKRNGDDLDTVMRWLISPYQCDDVWLDQIDTLRRYSIENGWKLINGMVNGYLVEPQLEDAAGIAETVLQWWEERDIDANEKELQNLVDRLQNRIAERQTVQ